MSTRSCELVYLDVGSNIGDSLHTFASHRPEARLRETLRVAGAANYQTATTCAFGFEPNPQHTAKLQAMQARLAPKFANLTVYTETAVGGPEQVAAPMWLVVAGGKSGVGSYLTTKRPASERATPVRTFRLSSWLREFLAPRIGPRVPVVMRADVEGVEHESLLTWERELQPGGIEL